MHWVTRFIKPTRLMGWSLKLHLNQPARSANTYKSRDEAVEVLIQLVSVRAAIMDRCAASRCMPRRAC